MRTATLADPIRVDTLRPDVVRAGTGRTRLVPGDADRVVPGRRAVPRRRPADDRAADNRPAPESVIYGPRIAATRCASPVGTRGRGLVPARVDADDRALRVAPPAAIRRRRRTAVAILAGVGLALAVWVLSVVGQNYAASVAPSAVGTEVVHVRSGDSLTGIAARVAPDLPREAVVEDIIRLNDLPSSGLRVGQPLLTPRYR